jgi:hypothetical protein
MDDYEDPRVRKLRGRTMEENHKQDCVLALEKMKQASDAFYLAAVKTNKHQFVEFNGLLVKYIEILRKQFMAGEDIITEERVPMEFGDALYIGEKLNCIFGETLMSDAKVRGAFLTKLFPGAAINFETHDEFVDSIT